MPRISKRTPTLENEILSRLASGEPLAQICRDDKMPHPTSWRVWCDADEKLAFAYARAREDGADAIAADCLSIIDEAPERVVTMNGDDRSESRIDGASVQRAKNRAELRLKLLAKWDPKRYGDKTILSNDPESPVTKPESDPVDIARRIAFLLRKAEKSKGS